MPHRPRATLEKSDSCGSCDSSPAVGTFPPGSLKVHDIPDSELVMSTATTDRMDTDDGEEEPPPLEEDSRHPGAVHRPSLLRHDKGGGDVLILLDLPEVFTVGYDCISFTAKHFGGLRDIPQGSHFIWVAHPGGLSIRCGAWIISSGVNQVHVLQWDKYNEMLVETSAAEARIQADNVDQIHDKLAPYNDPASVNRDAQGQEKPNWRMNFQSWQMLTGMVSKKVLDRVTGQESGEWFVHTADRVQGAEVMAAEVELDKRLSNPFLRGRDLCFSLSQKSKTYTMQNTGSDRTLEARDATSYILALLQPGQGLSDEDIVGEFQFAYVVGSHLGNDACIQQWWHMVVKIILKAFTLPVHRPKLARDLLHTLASQITHGHQYLETPIWEYSEAQARDLRLALTIYKRRLAEELPDTTQVSLAFSKVEATVAEPPLEWNLNADDYVRRGNVMMEDGETVEVDMHELQDEDERGEYAPEVVEFDDLGKEKGLVSFTD